MLTCTGVTLNSSISHLTLTTGVKAFDKYSHEASLITTAGTTNIHAGTCVRPLQHIDEQWQTVQTDVNALNYCYDIVEKISRGLTRETLETLKSEQKKHPMDSFFVSAIRTNKTFYGVLIFKKNAPHKSYQLTNCIVNTGRSRVMGAVYDWVKNSLAEYEQLSSWIHFVKSDVIKAHPEYPVAIVAYEKNGDNAIFGLDLNTEKELLDLHQKLKENGRLPYFTVCTPKGECEASCGDYQVPLINGDYGVAISIFRARK